MIVARTFSTTADTALVNNAVNMAVANRNRRGATILHADHGTQGEFNWSSQHLECGGVRWAGLRGG
jgi:transposase InsO family protein